MKLYERMEMIAQKKCGSRKKLADLLGEKQTTFNGYFNDERENKFKAKHLERILATYPELNPVWLLTGKGEMEDAYDPARLKKARDQAVHSQRPSLSAIILGHVAEMVHTLEDARRTVDPDVTETELLDSIIPALVSRRRKLGPVPYGKPNTVREQTLAHEDNDPYVGDACGIDQQKPKSAFEQMLGDDAAQGPKG